MCVYVKWKFNEMGRGKKERERVLQMWKFLCYEAFCMIMFVGMTPYHFNTNSARDFVATIDYEISRFTV